MNNEKTTKILTINEKLYTNRIIESAFDIEAKKQAKKELKTILLNVANSIKMNKENYATLILSETDFKDLYDNANKIIDLSKGITYKAMKNAILSSITNKLVASDEKFVKVEGYSISVANFLKSLQASITKKVESEKRQQYLIDQQKKMQLKKDKELSKARKKANKKVEKTQLKNGTLKTKID